MKQCPREIVQAALRQEGPERLPVRMASLGVDDTAWIWSDIDERVEKNGVQYDPWGCGWEHTATANMGQVKVHPLADLSHHEDLSTPDYTAAWHFEGLEDAFKRAEQEGLYSVAVMFMALFERMHALAGFQNTLLGLLSDPQNAAALADKVLNTQIALVRAFQERFGSRLHAFWMTDDWGTQQAAFLDMDLWRSFFLPRYRKLFSVIHEGGQDAWIHTCGKVNDVIQGLIDAGADAVNLQQPRALGIENIGRRYRGKIAFESLADIQATLPTNDETRIKKDAAELAEHWMSPEGGFVFSDYGDGEAIGVPDEAKRIMYRAFSRVSEDVYGNPLPPLPN